MRIHLPTMLEVLGCLTALALAACSGGGTDTASPSTAPSLASPTTAEPGTTDPPTTLPSPPSTAAPAVTLTTAPPSTPSTTEPPATTDPDPHLAVAFASAYGPPDGNVDDLLDLERGRFSAHGVIDYTGDLEGTGRYVFGSLSHPNGVASGLAGAMLVQFDGRVAPCGTGTAVLIGEYAIDPTADPPTHLVWRVLPGYGTGDLATLTGGGFGSGRDGLDSGDATLTGEVTCEGSWDGRYIAAVPDAGMDTVDLVWSYAAGDNVTDPGGLEFLGAGTDPASGRLGLIHGHGTLAIGAAPWPTPTITDTTAMDRVWVAIEHPGGWVASGGTRIDVIRYEGTLPGCGTGSMIVLGTAEFPSGGYPDGYDPNHPVDSTYSWRVVDGYGSAGLAGASGLGSGTTRENAIEGAADLEGSVNCHT